MASPSKQTNYAIEVYDGKRWTVIGHWRSPIATHSLPAIVLRSPASQPGTPRPRTFFKTR